MDSRNEEKVDWDLPIDPSLAHKRSPERSLSEDIRSPHLLVDAVLTYLRRHLHCIV